MSWCEVRSPRQIHFPGTRWCRNINPLLLCLGFTCTLLSCWPQWPWLQETVPCSYWLGPTALSVAGPKQILRDECPLWCGRKIVLAHTKELISFGAGTPLTTCLAQERVGLGAWETEYSSQASESLGSHWNTIWRAPRGNFSLGAEGRTGSKERI